MAIQEGEAEDAREVGDETSLLSASCLAWPRGTNAAMCTNSCLAQQRSVLGDVAGREILFSRRPSVI